MKFYVFPRMMGQVNGPPHNPLDATNWFFLSQASQDLIKHLAYEICSRSPGIQKTVNKSALPFAQSIFPQPVISSQYDGGICKSSMTKLR